MNVFDTRLPGVKCIELDVHYDQRGFFLESFHGRRYQELLGLDTPFVQDNYTHSRGKVLRGLHVQTRHPQGKLIRVVQGRIFDVAVDLRPDSAHFGQWYGTMLSRVVVTPVRSIHRQLWIPPGFAHGFVVLSPWAAVEYKCTDYYYPEYEACLCWNDPDLAIDWPVAKPILSLRDWRGQALRDWRTALDARQGSQGQAYGTLSE